MPTGAKKTENRRNKRKTPVNRRVTPANRRTDPNESDSSSSSSSSSSAGHSSDYSSEEERVETKKKSSTNTKKSKKNTNSKGPSLAFPLVPPESLDDKERETKAPSTEELEKMAKISKKEKKIQQQMSAISERSEQSVKSSVKSNSQKLIVPEAPTNNSSAASAMTTETVLELTGNNFLNSYLIQAILLKNIYFLNLLQLSYCSKDKTQYI